MKIGFSLLVGLALLVQGCSTVSQTHGPDNTPEPTPLTKSGAVKSPPAGKETPVAGSDKAAPAGAVAGKAKKPQHAEPPRLTGELLYYLLSAEIAGQRGRLDIAVPFYLKAAQLSRDPAVAERATRVAVYARDDKSALKAALLWVEVQPNRSEAHQVSAALLVRKGDIDAALPHMEWVLQHPKKDQNGYMLITSLLSKEHDKKRALQAMERLIDKRPDDLHAIYAYAHLAMLVGANQKAEMAINKVLQGKPRWVEAHILQANILIRMGEHDKVLKLLSKAVDEMPDSTLLRTYYARKLVDEKQIAAARDQFEIVLDYQPKDADALFALGLLNLQLDKADEAKQYFESMIEDGQRVAEANYYLGQSGEMLKDESFAIEHYNEVRNGKHYVDAQIRIAVILARQGKVDAARERLQNVSAQTLDVELRLTLAEGEILRSAGKYKEAVAVYNVALQQMPGNSQLLYARALLYEKLDRVDEAVLDLALIVKNEPNNAEALNALGYTLVDQTNRFKEGLGYIEQAFKLKPDDAAILDSLGWAHYRLGNKAKALEYLAQAFKKLNDPEIAAHLGEVLWVMGKQAKARQVWQEALSNAPSDKVLLNVIQRFTQ